MKPMFLPGVEHDAKPSPYRTLIEQMQEQGLEYPQIWHLFAYLPSATEHLARFTQEILRGPFVRIDERDPLGAVLADQWSRLGHAPDAGITVQTHHIAMVLAEQGFGPAIIDSFTARASRSDTLHVRTLLPEVPVEVRALLPLAQGVSKPVADFVAAFRAVTAADG